MRLKFGFICCVLALSQSGFAQTGNNTTPQTQSYNGTIPININVPYNGNNVLQYHSYWQTQRSGPQQHSGKYANEPASLIPLLKALDKFNSDMARIPDGHPGHPSRTGAIQKKWVLESRISQERIKIEAEIQSQNEHLSNVVSQVEAFLQVGFSQQGDLAVSVRVQYALKTATEKREENSLDLVARDAEYYMHGLYASLSGDIEHIAFTGAAALYDDLKALNVSWINDIIQVDSANPLSPPGGAPWAYMGLKDGYNLRHLSTNEVGPGNHGLNTSLNL